MDKEKYLGKLDLGSPDVKQRLGKGPTLTHISLFSGCGGLDLGFAHAGIQTRVMIERDKSCCETLRHNFLWEYLKDRRHGHYVNKDGSPLKGPAYTGKVKWIEDELVWKNKREFLKEGRDYKKKIKKMKKEGKEISYQLQMASPPALWYYEPEPVILERDICEVSTKEILEAGKLQVGECSIVSGGFPCQGFSLAGKRVRDDPRNFLYREFVRIVDEAKPAMIMGENVPGIVSMGKGEVIQQICKDFANCGYDIAWDILDAANYGVPQHRERVILIGKRIDMMSFNGKKRPSFRIGAIPGKITHPYLLKERLKRWKNKELLEEMEKDPQIEFMEKENGV